MIKQALKSRTIIVMMVSAGLEAALATIHTVEPFMSDASFVFASAGLGIGTAMVGVYMRLITTVPISQK